MACMTAAYLETSSRNLSNEVVLVVTLTLCVNLVYATVFLCYLQGCRGISLLYKSWIVQSRWTT